MDTFTFTRLMEESTKAIFLSKQEEAKTARRTQIDVVFDNTNITKNLNEFLISFTFTDNEAGQADDISIELDDRDGLWIEKWLNPEESGEPLKGHTLQITIQQINYADNSLIKTLDCGIFCLDSVGLSGPPARVSLKACTILDGAAIKNEKHSRQWEGYTLKDIAAEIAKKAGYTLLFDSKQNQTYSRIEQSQEADLPFLEKLCVDAGLSLKITNQQIVIFEAVDYEAAPAIKTFYKSDLSSWKFDVDTLDKKYTSCTVKYTSPITQKTIEATYPPSGEDVDQPDEYEEYTDKKGRKRKRKKKKKKAPKGEVLNITTEKVDSKEAALELAKKRLREKNKAEYKASINLLGDVDLQAGLCIMLADFGAFSGKYIIEQATHNVTGGYKTALKLRRVMNY